MPCAGSRVESPRNIDRLQNMCHNCFSSGFCVPKLLIESELSFEEKNCGIVTCGMNNLEIDRIQP